MTVEKFKECLECLFIFTEEIYSSHLVTLVVYILPNHLLVKWLPILIINTEKTDIFIKM